MDHSSGIQLLGSLIWQRAKFTASARYIQFSFTNTNGTSTMGFLAEIKVFGSLGSFDPSQDPPTPTATSAPTAIVHLEPTSTSTEPAPADTVTIEASPVDSATATLISTVETTATEDGLASPVAGR